MTNAESVFLDFVRRVVKGDVDEISRRLAEWLDSPRFADERLAHGLATQRLFAATIAATECRLEGDLLHEAEGDGLGVTIDEDSLQHHRIR